MSITSTKKSATPKAGHNSKRTLDVIAGNIHALERRSAFDIGKLLIEAKETCEYGDWSHWLEEEFDWSPDTASRYIAASRLADRFRTVRNLKVPMRVIYDLASDLDDPDLPAIVEALVKANKSASKRISVAAAEKVMALARLRARYGDYPEATLNALDLLPEDEWAKAAAEKLKELRPTTEEEAYRIIAEFKPSESGQQPEPDPDDAQAEQADDGVEGGEPAEQPVTKKGWSRERWRRYKERKRGHRSKNATPAAAPPTPAQARQDIGPAGTGEVERLRARVDELQDEKRQLEIKIVGLESENAELKAANAELRAKREAAGASRQRPSTNGKGKEENGAGGNDALASADQRKTESAALADAGAITGTPASEPTKNGGRAATSPKRCDGSDPVQSAPANTPTIEERAAAIAVKGVQEPIPDFLLRKPTEVVS